MVQIKVLVLCTSSFVASNPVVDYSLFFILLQVSIYNLEEYISLVVDATVKTGIMRQVDAFKAGFNQVISFF